MTDSTIISQRLINQQLSGTNFKTPQHLVSYIGALQAQDYTMAKWAIGIHLGNTEAEVDKALKDGNIYRTHVLRPTWHFISARDIHWLLALTGPHVKALNSRCAESWAWTQKHSAGAIAS